MELVSGLSATSDFCPKWWKLQVKPIQWALHTSQTSSIIPIYIQGKQQLWNLTTEIMYNYALWRMESKEVTASLVVMDLSVVFDTVDHDILLPVLHNHFGITSNALIKQTPQLLSPQGGCGGPIIFMAYSSTL